MKYIFLFISVFLYADISNILFKIDKIENYKPVFEKIYLRKCNNSEKIVNQEAISKKEALNLMAIFNKKALVNGEWVKEGDIIKGYEIIKIYPKKVILKKENRIVVLKFDNNLLKVKK